MKPRTQEKPVVDPVCGMSVDPKTAKQRRSSRDRSIISRKAFEENPEKYMGSECSKPKGWWGRYMQRLKKSTGGKAMKCH